MRLPKLIILINSSRLLGSVKNIAPVISESATAPPVPLVPLPGLAQSTCTAKRRLSRQRVCASGRQEPAAAAARVLFGSAGAAGRLAKADWSIAPQSPGVFP